MSKNWIVALATLLWIIALRLVEHAMLGWGDDQIAALFGITSPTLSTVIPWVVPILLGAASLWIFHHVTTKPLKEALASKSGGKDRFYTTGNGLWKDRWPQ